jgi:hypothetical protein
MSMDPAKMNVFLHGCGTGTGGSRKPMDGVQMTSVTSLHRTHNLTPIELLGGIWRRRFVIENGIFSQSAVITMLHPDIMTAVGVSVDP